MGKEGKGQLFFLWVFGLLQGNWMERKLYRWVPRTRFVLKHQIKDKRDVLKKLSTRDRMVSEEI
jgi:hypothetical protein